MAKYMVERHLPGIKPDELAAAATRAKATTAEMMAGEAVREANKRAEFPLQTVTEAMHIASEDLD